MSDFITIKENRDYHRAYARGRSFVGSSLVTYVIKNKNNNLRIGITTSKKVGNAVQRNRSRRIIRAAFSQLNLDNCGGFDLIFVARGKTPFVKSTDILSCMKTHLQQAGVIK